MPEMNSLLSTLLSLPDDRRAAIERELVPLARAAALGELAADVAHDVANPLFGAIGLVDLLLEDAAQGSEEATRLELLAQATSQMRRTLDVLLDFARLAGDEAQNARLRDATRAALRLLRHGVGKTLEVEERYVDNGEHVPCPPGLLVQAVLQFLLAARGAAPLILDVEGAALRITPAPAETLGAHVAGRIVTDHGATVERDERSLTVRWLQL